MIRKYVSSMVLVTLLFSCSFSIVFQAGFDFMNDPEFSKMMEEFERELENLTPEERAQFDEVVQEFARVIQDMPEEEFEQLLADIDADMQAAREMDEFEVPVSAAEVSPIPSVPVLRIEIPQEIKELADTLQNLKVYVTLFLSKVQIAPDVALKIDKWFQQGKILHAPDQFTWIQCADELEMVASLLTIMLETDTRSNPVFLFEIHKDAQLEALFKEYAEKLSIVPVIDMAEFGIKQEKDTQEMIRQILSEFCEMLFVQNIKERMISLYEKHKEVLEQKGVKPPVFLAPSQGATQPPKTPESLFAPENEDEEFFFDENFEASDFSMPMKQEQATNLEKNTRVTTEVSPKIEDSTNTLQKQLADVVSSIQLADIERFTDYLGNSELPFVSHNVNLDIPTTISRLKELEKTTEKVKQENKKINVVESDIQEIDAFNNRIENLLSLKNNSSPEKRFVYFQDTTALEEIRKINAKKASDLEKIDVASYSLLNLVELATRLSTELKNLNTRKEN